MRIERNYDNFDENEGVGYTILPNGTYMFEVSQTEDKLSSNKDEMVKVTFNCIEENYYGTPVWDNILFPRPGSKAEKIIGRTKRFLHCLGEPYQGDFEVDTDNWQGKTIEIQVKTSEYEDKNGNKKPKNDVMKYILNEELLNNTNINTKNALPWDKDKEINNNNETEDEDDEEDYGNHIDYSNLPF